MADPSDVDKLLENVEQFVNDENKIVSMSHACLLPYLVVKIRVYFSF